VSPARYGGLQPGLHRLSRPALGRHRRLIDDEVLDRFTVKRNPAEVGAVLEARYDTGPTQFHET
jgi:hypothetical protein